MTGRAEGKVALITGAARGQGRSHAVRLAQEGADIIAVDLCGPIDSVPYALATADDLRQTVKEVEALGQRILATEADVRDFPSLKAAVERGVAELGRLDIVSAGAGVWTAGLLADMSSSDWGDVIDVNLTGTWHTAKAAIPHLVAGGRGGSIVLTCSVAGLKGFGGLGSYTASKHGMVGLMRALAVELAPHGIRVNTLHPTQVDTLMIQNDALWQLFMPDEQNPTKADFAPASQQMNALPVPWVESSDVTNALLFLVSDDARYITGAALPIDAGALLK